MDLVMSSFAMHAPAETWLVVKCHPLDNDLTRRDIQTLKIAAQHGISQRVLFVDGGHLPTLLSKALGIVTINSTVGTSAFDHSCPVKALGRAIYNFAGLGDQQPLESFWKNPEKPDPRVHAAFRNFLLENCLVPGSFYSRQGIAMGVKAAAELLEKRARSKAIPHA
jgi:capsular polysaccharide export protein